MKAKASQNKRGESRDEEGCLRKMEIFVKQ